MFGPLLIDRTVLEAQRDEDDCVWMRMSGNASLAMLNRSMLHGAAGVSDLVGTHLIAEVLDGDDFVLRFDHGMWIEMSMREEDRRFPEALRIETDGTLVVE